MSLTSYPGLLPVVYNSQCLIQNISRCKKSGIPRRSIVTGTDSLVVDRKLIFHHAQVNHSKVGKISFETCKPFYHYYQFFKFF